MARSAHPTPPSDLFTVDTLPLTPLTVWRPRFWLQVLQAHPFGVLGAVWGGLVLVAIVAMAGLMSPNHSQSLRPAAPPAPSAIAPAAEGELVTAWPIWSLVGVVGSCAIGSLVLSRILALTPDQERELRRQERTLRAKQSKSRRRRLRAQAKIKAKPAGLKRLAPYQATDFPGLTPTLLPPEAIPADAIGFESEEPGVTTTEPLISEPAIAAVATLIQSTTVPRSSQPSEPQVSVLPPDVAHPLDWDEPSLAHVLDLRQQFPLKAVMERSARAS